MKKENKIKTITNQSTVPEKAPVFKAGYFVVSCKKYDGFNIDWIMNGCDIY